MPRVSFRTPLFLVVAAIACTDNPRTPTAPPVSLTPKDSVLEATLSSTDRSRFPLAGGATTVFDATAEAFGHPSPNLSADHLALHELGDAAFSAIFVPSPATMNGGLGPIFDNTSCEGCHVGDGRGRPPLPGEPFESMLFRASIPGTDPHGGPVAVPGFGGQLRMRAIPGFQPEVVASITYAESTGVFADGSRYSLRVPHYRFTAYEPLPRNLLFSPRTAPANFGLGLLEAVPVDELRQLADPFDRDHDGISGRLNIAWDVVQQRYAVGRFGWKAEVPSLRQQDAGAFNGDMGITSSLFPAESCEGDLPGCERHAPEIDDATIDAVTFYTQSLGVPARRNVGDQDVQRGEALFAAAGCGGCHVQTLTTGTVPGIPENSNQTIHPYTDLLVHDMGPALADNRPDFGANGREWRTAPLWGIGLVQVVNGHTNFIHDGRARNLLEAVLWHGGEGTKARETVKRMSASQRAALIKFLNSL
jgi:CxxC motif-containing protein (DUF1111 family)